MHDDRASEDLREAAVIAALILAQHPAPAVQRDHLAMHARAVLDTSSDGPNRTARHPSPASASFGPTSNRPRKRQDPARSIRPDGIS
ncbi:hypothetical protein ACH4F3_36595 [Streptomyces anulatus]